MPSLSPLPLTPSPPTFIPQPQLLSTRCDYLTVYLLRCSNREIFLQGLAEQLVQEVKRLQQELNLTKAKLATAEELIHKMPSEGTPCTHTHRLDHLHVSPQHACVSSWPRL